VAKYFSTHLHNAVPTCYAEAAVSC
jgi:hypothetical protein